MRFRALWAALLLGIPKVSGFGFSLDTPTPTQCDNISVSWTGGIKPFRIILTPVYGAPLNFSVSDGNNFRTPLTFPTGTEFLITMFDSTGWASGITSQILTVGPTLGGSCNPTISGVAFTFSLSASLTQCSPYTFSDYAGGIQPITILGLIPTGQVFVLTPPTGSSTYSWISNVASGTSIVFIMYDSQGRSGGSSQVEIVGSSNDNTCIGSNSPSSTSVLPSSTSSHTSPSSSSSAPAPSPSSTVSVGLIAGTVAGGLVLLAAFVSLGLFLFRRLARKKNNDLDLADSHAGQRFSLHTRLDSEFDGPPPRPPGQVVSQYPYPLTPGIPYTPGAPYTPDALSTQHLLSEQYMPTPYTLNHSIQRYGNPPSQGYSTYSGNSTSEPSELPYSVDQFAVASTSMPNAPRKGAATTNSAPRFIMHTDVEEVSPNQDEVIELPPQYSATRAPLHPSVLSPPLPDEKSGPGK